MSIEGWYYLHTNGDLIYKSDLPGMVEDIRESDLAKSLWPFDSTDRTSAWRIVVEGLALGANKKRIEELAKLWGCDDRDAIFYACRLNVSLNIDGDAICAMQPNFINLQESIAGFGDTCLEALADLCKNLGFKGGKIWNHTFKSLCKACTIQQPKPAELLADKDKCPDCGRSKAHNAQDILEGACPKWYAIKDPEAENDCKKIRKTEIKITTNDITENFLKNNDGKLVWIRDDYLSMRGITDDRDLLKILDKVADLKTTMRKKGHIFII